MAWVVFGMVVMAVVRCEVVELIVGGGEFFLLFFCIFNYSSFKDDDKFVFLNNINKKGLL